MLKRRKNNGGAERGLLLVQLKNQTKSQYNINNLSAQKTKKQNDVNLYKNQAK
jgi:hypothetical protein